MRLVQTAPHVAAEDEWSPLSAVIVGRAENSCFPSEPRHMIAATMPEAHQHRFHSNNPFPSSILAKANQELDQLVAILEKEGIQVYRPDTIDWTKIGGYTAAMPRDGLLTVGNTIIEACFAWRCRRYEIDLAFSNILSELAHDPTVTIVRAPRFGADVLYDGQINKTTNGSLGSPPTWAINNGRPAFDAADFMRFGKIIIGQLSNVTNQKGVDYLRAVVPLGYTVELLDVNDPHAMHIDATILPLRQGLLIFNPERVTEESLRKHEVLQGWEMHPYPFTPTVGNSRPPLYMTSAWLCLNTLSINESKMIIETHDTEFAEWLKQFGIEAIFCDFQHVNSIGGSFHCATVDLVRDLQ